MYAHKDMYSSVGMYIHMHAYVHTCACMCIPVSYMCAYAFVCACMNIHGGPLSRGQVGQGSSPLEDCCPPEKGEW